MVVVGISLCTQLRVNVVLLYRYQSTNVLKKGSSVDRGATNVHAEPATTNNGISLLFANSVGDLDGDNRDELAFVTIMDEQNCVIIVSSRNDDYTDTFSYPAVCFKTAVEYSYAISCVFAVMKDINNDQTGNF